MHKLIDRRKQHLKKRLNEIKRSFLSRKQDEKIFNIHQRDFWTYLLHFLQLFIWFISYFQLNWEKKKKNSKHLFLPKTKLKMVSFSLKIRVSPPLSIKVSKKTLRFRIAFQHYFFSSSCKENSYHAKCFSLDVVSLKTTEACFMR